MQRLQGMFVESEIERVFYCQIQNQMYSYVQLVAPFLGKPR